MEPGSLTDRVFELFQIANSEGWERELIEVARASNPGHRGLLAMAQELALAPALPPQLESIVSAHNRIHDADSWHRRLGEALNRLCRIELDGRPSGTGFLIGPDLVLTNHHVIEPLHHALVARFDYRQVGGRTSEGVAARVIAVVDLSPASPHDVESSSAREPSTDELDCALLRIDRALGSEPVGAHADPDAPPRGWFASSEPPSASLAADAN